MKTMNYHVKVTYNSHVFLDTDAVFEYDDTEDINIKDAIYEYMYDRGLSDMIDITVIPTTEIQVAGVTFDMNESETQSPYLKDLYRKIEQETKKDFYMQIITNGDIEITRVKHKYNDDFPYPSDYDAENIDSILAGEGSWFGANLLRLIAKADSDNIELLEKSYPNHVLLVESYLGR